MNKSKALKLGAGTLAGVLLGGALVYYNFIHKDGESGFEIGKPCPDFTVATYAVENGKFVAGEDFTLSQSQGKVRVVNFWETWCASCIHELPAFDKLQTVYPESVEVIAIAGNSSTFKQAQDWMNQNGWETLTPDVDWRDFSLTLGVQKTEMEVYNRLGGGGALPRTVIVDRTGKVVFGKEGDMSYEDLDKIVSELL